MNAPADDARLGADELTPALYAELHRLAARHLRGERRDHTLEPTALLHEAYLKLSGGDRRFSNRTHFLAVASRVMRQVLVDHARARATAKRGALAIVHDEEGLAAATEPPREPVDVLRVHLAIEAMARDDEALARIIELRYFGGLLPAEIAAHTNRTVHAVRHTLRIAQAWLRRELSR